MDLQLVNKGFDYTRKRKNWVLLLAAMGFSGYGVYRVYHSPSVVKKRKKFLKLFGALISVAEMVSDSAEMIGVVSKDLNQFIQSDSDKIPNSLRQIAKITRSDEFSQSTIGITRALTVGILRGYRSEEARRDSDGIDADSSFSNRLLDKLFSTAGSGFASAVVGSFARNLVMAFYSDQQSNMNNNSDHGDRDSLRSDSVPSWVNVLCDDKYKELIGDCIQLFVSTAVSVYLEKTMNINTYDELFSGLTNPKHEREMREMLASVCNGAVQTLVKTSHQVLSSSKPNANSSSSYLAIDGFRSPSAVNGQQLRLAKLKPRKKSFDENEESGWASKMSSTLAVPSNRRLVLDVTGRVTFETVRSFLEFLIQKLTDGLKRSVDVVHEQVVDRGFDAVRYATAKSSVVVTLCLSLCLHVLGGPWILVPSNSSF